jgi:hypothetical protein
MGSSSDTLGVHVVMIFQYDWIIFSRSDYLYLCPARERLEDLPRDSIYIPNGVDYGGFTDRHHVMPTELALLALNVSESVVLDWRFYDNSNNLRMSK